MPPCPIKPCCPAGTTCFTVTGCSSAPLAGATVTITVGGSTTSSGTTDATGKACVTVPSAGAYVVGVTQPRYTAYSHSYASGASPVLGIGLAVASGYFCCPGTACPVPFPSTYTLTDSEGSITLTSTGGAWTGTQTITAQVSNFPTLTPCTVAGTFGINFSLQCTGTGWTLGYNFYSYPCGGAGTPSNTSQVGSTAVSCSTKVGAACSDPTTLTFTLPATFSPADSGGFTAPVPLSGTVAIS